MKTNTKMNVLGILLLFGIFAVAGTYLFKSQNPQTVSEEEFGQQVRAYLLKNPAVIREAIEVLTAQEQSADQERNRVALEASKQELENDGFSFVGGNPNGDVTIVEFFDYKCGYCKRAFPTLMKTVKDDGNVRLVMKEFPILGDQSILAAQAVMAAQNQGKYEEFHKALMQAKGAFTKQRILAYAADIGLDISKLETDMQSDAIKSYIRRNYELARTLGINGTPAFVIGGKLVPGAIPEEQMKTLIAEARANSGPTATN